ncbi:hypothetical protein JCM24511_06204 [Saitozyma sp. JCM 24511]|nr:hypothetical protein JCM24511_06204 [Saitozyma sp. JCM 24511]
MAHTSGSDSGSSRRDPLVAIPPPQPPSDLVQSALHLPLENITRGHRGRKLRTTGQIIHFDIKSSLLVLGAATPSPTSSPNPNPDPSVGAGPSRRTLLVNASIPLLGKSPSAKDVSEAYGSVWGAGETSQPTSVPVLEGVGVGSAGLINRERLRIERGEWVCVVGWLEGEVSRRIELPPESGFASPMEIVLETIHLSPSRPPMGGTVYRGEVDVQGESSWMGRDVT